MAYWDTAALAKLYIHEPDSPRYGQILRESLVHCAFWRKEISGAVRHGRAEILFQNFLRQIESGDLKLILYDSRVKSRAIGVVRHCYGARRPVMIRSLDALQIASALEGGATEMVSADLRMRGCGILFGLRVLPE